MPAILSDATLAALRGDLTIILSWLGLQVRMPSADPESALAARSAARRIAQALPRLTGRRRAWTAGASSA